MIETEEERYSLVEVFLSRFALRVNRMVLAPHRSKRQVRRTFGRPFVLGKK